MSVDVARSHSGDIGGDPPPDPNRNPTSCESRISTKRKSRGTTIGKDLDERRQKNGKPLEVTFCPQTYKTSFYMKLFEGGELDRNRIPEAALMSLKHNPNGRFVVVCGDGEYIIYTALAWRNISFGSALEFAWSSDGEYAVRESTTRIKLFNKTFQKKKNIRPTFLCEHMYGGTLLAMCSNDFICFYDWVECRLIRRIDVNVKNVYLAVSGDLVAIASESSFYILKYNRDVVSSFFDSGSSVDEQGVEDAFELLYEINERARTGIWVGDCFIYTNTSWRLNYCVGGEVTTMCHLDRPMYLLGYLANQSWVYLIDKDFNVKGYTLLLSLIEYKTLVMRGDLDHANQILPTIPPEHHNSVARFLESRGMLDDALEVATDPDYKFDLAIQLG
ncbi:coatomer subunit beta'-1-like [Humulus lupulus]|uniref:coatomer subunit beta'-1-like n=1 Tax=Humulus lupulus TaxID=3486 RepID=UPI002B4036E6|nr:coatomer subunit beta'-1-like [Humulus lupulus]